MNSQIEASSASPYASRAQKQVDPKTPKRSYWVFFLSWFLLIAAGVFGTMTYTEYLREQITNDIALQTRQQLQTVQTDYEKQLTALKENMTSEMTQLQAKVDSFNELLSFMKDSANNKTDNSNQLYTQLAEVKKKLDELKKNLDVLQ